MAIKIPTPQQISDWVNRANQKSFPAPAGPNMNVAPNMSVAPPAPNQSVAPPVVPPPAAPSPKPAAQPAPKPPAPTTGPLAAAAGPLVFSTGQEVLGHFASRLSAEQKFRDVLGVVRIEGNPTAITIGRGGGMISRPEDLLKAGFGDKDIVDISPEVAKQLGINVENVLRATGPARTTLDVAKTKQETGGQLDPNEIAALDAEANANQESEATTIDEEATEAEISDSAKLTEKLIGMLEGDEAKPPSLVETFNTKRAELGIGELEADLAAANADVEKLDADYASTLEESELRPTSMRAIRRRQSADDIAYRRARRDLVVERNSIANQVNQKLGVLNTMVQLTGMDIDNAQQEYQFKFNAAISLTNLVRGIENDQKSDAERKSDNARANAQIMYNLIKSGNVDYANLDESTKADIKAMEISAGLPVGFTQFITETLEEPAVSFLPAYTDASGRRIQPVGVIDKNTGAFKITNVDIGQAKAEGGGGGKSAEEKAREKEEKAQESRDSEFEKFAKEMANKVYDGDMTREEARDRIKAFYPDYDENVIYDLVPDESV